MDRIIELQAQIDTIAELYLETPKYGYDNLASLVMRFGKPTKKDFISVSVGYDPSKPAHNDKLADTGAFTAIKNSQDLYGGDEVGFEVTSEEEIVRPREYKLEMKLSGVDVINFALYKKGMYLGIFETYGSFLSHVENLEAEAPNPDLFERALSLTPFCAEMGNSAKDASTDNNVSWTQFLASLQDGKNRLLDHISDSYAAFNSYVKIQKDSIIYN